MSTFNIIYTFFLNSGLHILRVRGITCSKYFSSAPSAAVAQSCAWECSPYAVALSSATFLAATSEKSKTSLSCLWELCPKYVPAIVTMDPNLITWRRQVMHGNEHLFPTEASVIGSSLRVLSESFPGWWNSVNGSAILGEETLASTVDLVFAAGAVIE